MLLKINDLSINVVCDNKAILEKVPVIFLHGFTGCSEDWSFLLNQLPSNFTPIFIDLIGHGKSSSPNNAEKYSAEFQIEILKNLIEKLAIQNFILVGYSMGGRLALSFTAKYPTQVSALVLESTSFGLATKNEREERINLDRLLAEKINNSPMTEFIEYWMKIPLFDSLSKISPKVFEQLKQRKIINNNSVGLKNSLLGFSSGKMKNFYPILQKLNTKVLLISGKLDDKYTAITTKASLLLPNSLLKIVDDCGHNVHFEKPEEFLKLLNSFLLNIRDY